MKLKYKLILPLLFVLCIVNAQEEIVTPSPATNKGSVLLTGILGFSSSQSLKLYNGSDRKTRLLQFNASFVGFVEDKFGLGIDLGIERINSGGSTITTIQLGPRGGYYFDNGSNTIPYFSFGLNYIHSKFNFDDGKSNGLRFNITGGLLIRMEHFAVNIEAGYRKDNYRDKPSARIIFMGVGMSACLYKDVDE